MNIVLADVQSINVNASASAPEGELSNGEFSDLMEQNLSQDTELTAQTEFPQVIENKELNLSIDLPVDAQFLSVIGTESTDSGVDYLVNRSIEDPLEPASPNVLETALVVNVPVEINQLAAVAVNPALGESLPASGKVLPPVELRGNAHTRSSGLVVPAQTQVDSGDSSDAKPFPETASKAVVSEIPGLARPNAPVENSNIVSRTAEFQVVSNGMSEMGEDNAIQNRTLAPVNVGFSSNQPSNPLLSAQLDTLSVSNPRDSGAWSSGIGERINLMVNQKINTATMRLDPPMLGRLEIHIQVADDTTNVTINTQHAQTRDMIENASHRLREFLQENGYQNVNVDVSHQQEQQQQASEEAADDLNFAEDEAVLSRSNTGGIDSEGNRYLNSESLVDYFV